MSSRTGLGPRTQVRVLNAEPLGYAVEARRILEPIGEIVEAAVGREELLRMLPAFDVLIVRLGHRVDREMLDAGPRLRAIATATTGLDHVDVHEARARGIQVISLRGEEEFLQGIPATAEHTWALLLALVRRVPAAARSVLAGEWDRDAFPGRELAGKRLGIVGLGRVGSMVARYGLAFGMEVAAWDPREDRRAHDVERASDLASLLRRSDVLTLHATLGPETARMIGPEEFHLLPRGAVLVNTARGALVDENTLVEALAEGRLAGAAVDVLEGEREPDRRRRSPLVEWARSHDNVIVTPHVGGATEESMGKTEVFIARQLASFLASGGERP